MSPNLSTSSAVPPPPVEAVHSNTTKNAIDMKKNNKGLSKLESSPATGTSPSLSKQTKKQIKKEATAATPSRAGTVASGMDEPPENTTSENQSVTGTKDATSTKKRKQKKGKKKQGVSTAVNQCSTDNNNEKDLAPLEAPTADKSFSKYPRVTTPDAVHVSMRDLHSIAAIKPSKKTKAKPKIEIHQEPSHLVTDKERYRHKNRKPRGSIKIKKAIRDGMRNPFADLRAQRRRELGLDNGEAEELQDGEDDLSEASDNDSSHESYESYTPASTEADTLDSPTSGDDELRHIAASHGNSSAVMCEANNLLSCSPDQMPISSAYENDVDMLDFDDQQLPKVPDTPTVCNTAATPDGLLRLPNREEFHSLLSRHGVENLISMHVLPLPVFGSTRKPMQRKDTPHAKAFEGQQVASDGLTSQSHIISRTAATPLGLLRLPNKELYPSPLPLRKVEEIISIHILPLPIVVPETRLKQRKKVPHGKLLREQQPALGGLTAQSPIYLETATTPLGLVSLPNEALYPSSLSLDKVEEMISAHVMPVPPISPTTKTKTNKPAVKAKSSGKTAGVVVEDTLTGLLPDKLEINVDKPSLTLVKTCEVTAELPQFPWAINCFDAPANDWLAAQKAVFDELFPTEAITIEPAVLEAAAPATPAKSKNRVTLGDTPSDEVQDTDSSGARSNSSPNTVQSSPAASISTAQSYSGSHGFNDDVSLFGRAALITQNTFIGHISLADFINVLDFNENDNIPRENICEVFHHFSSEEKELIGMSTTSLFVGNITSPVTQSRIKLGTITLRTFLKEMSFDDKDEVSVLEVARVFRHCSQLEQLCPHPNLLRLLQLEANAA